MTDDTKPRVQGIGRIADNDRAVLIMLSNRPTDDDMRSLHDFLRIWSGPSLHELVERHNETARAVQHRAEMRMLIDNDWLRRTIPGDPDEGEP